MDTILDHDEYQEKNDRRSKKSFLYFICVVLLFLGLLLWMRLNSGKMPSNFLNLMYGFLILGLIILGFKNAILSVRAKEKWSLYKVIGLIGNVFIFSITAIFLCFNLVDVLWWLNGN